MNSYEQLGQIFGNRYRIESVLIHGYPIVVYKARDLKINQFRFLALYCGELNRADPLFALVPLTTCARLGHPHIARIESCQQEGGRPYWIMPSYEGLELRAILRQHQRLPVSWVLPVLRQIGLALHHAHRQVQYAGVGIFHGDLKPQDIWISEGLILTGEPWARLLGLGARLATMSQPELSFARTTWCDRYAPPEGTFNRPDWLTLESDQYSLAAIGYHALSGVPAFDAPSTQRLCELIRYRVPTPLSSLVPGLPEQVGRAIHIALSKDPKARYPSMLDFLRALHRPVSPLEAVPIAIPPDAIPKHADARAALPQLALRPRPAVAEPAAQRLAARS